MSIWKRIVRWVQCKWYCHDWGYKTRQRDGNLLWYCKRCGAPYKGYDR